MQVLRQQTHKIMKLPILDSHDVIYQNDIDDCTIDIVMIYS